MSRHKIVLVLILAMVATSIGVAGSLRSQTSHSALEDSKVQASPELLPNAPRVDLEPNDGKGSGDTRGEVLKFQRTSGVKTHEVIGRQATIMPANAVAPSVQGGKSSRIEVDLTEQVLYYIENGQVIRTMPVSSGNGKSYRTKSGGRARALTPVGTFTIQRRIRGIRVSYLGVLHNPLYFYGGYAIHGSDSVPGYPASHGCIRVSKANGRWLFDRAPVGTTVVIHGGTHVFRP